MARRFVPVPAWWAVSVTHGFSSALRLGVTSLVAALVIAALWVPVSAVGGVVTQQRDGAGSQLNAMRVDVPPTETGGLGTSDRDELAAIPGVTDVSVALVASIAGSEGLAWSAPMVVMRPSLIPPGIPVSTKLDGDQVIAPARIDGIDLSVYVGRDLPITFTRGTGQSSGVEETGRLRLVATYDPGWSGYGQGVVLGSAGQVAAIYGAKYAETPQNVLDRHVESVWVQVGSQGDVERVARAIRDRGLDVTLERDRLGSLPGVLGVFPLLMLTVAIGFAVLLLAQVFTVVQSSTSRRRLEFGLLRIRGYSVRDLRALLTMDVVASVVLGALPGALAGLVVGAVLSGRLTPSELEVPRGGDAVVAALPMAGVGLLGLGVLCWLVALLATRRTLRTDPFLLVLGD